MEEVSNFINLTEIFLKSILYHFILFYLFYPILFMYHSFNDRQLNVCILFWKQLTLIWFDWLINYNGMSTRLGLFHV